MIISPDLEITTGSFLAFVTYLMVLENLTVPLDRHSTPDTTAVLDAAPPI
jgi:hypothetical protein